MIYNNVEVSDVQSLVPVTIKRTVNGVTEKKSSGDVGVLCSGYVGMSVPDNEGGAAWTVSSRIDINKWAWYKPIQYATLAFLDDAKRQEKKFGLTPTTNNTALQILRGELAMTEANFNLAIANTNEWIYNMPTGGANSPYRLHDFICEDPTLNRGYKHTTEPPICIGTDWHVNKTNLETVFDQYGVFSSGTAPNQTIIVRSAKSGSAEQLRCGLIPEHLFKMRFGVETAYNIGGADVMTIPLPFIFTLGEAWRMALMVYVPGYTAGGNTFDARIGVFVSTRILQFYNNNSETVPAILPDLATNQNLARHMWGFLDASNNASYSFRCLPILVKNVTISAGGTIDSSVTLQNTGQVYTMPSSIKGVLETSITVNDDTIIDSRRLATSGLWVLGILQNGQYGYVNGTLIPISNIVIYYDQETAQGAEPQIDVNAKYSLVFHRWVNNQQEEVTLNNTVDGRVIQAGQTITINGMRYYGTILDGGVGVTYVSGTPYLSVTGI